GAVANSPRFFRRERGKNADTEVRPYATQAAGDARMRATALAFDPAAVDSISCISLVERRTPSRRSLKKRSESMGEAARTARCGSFSRSGTEPERDNSPVASAAA